MQSERRYLILTHNWDDDWCCYLKKADCEYVFGNLDEKVMSFESLDALFDFYKKNPQLCQYGGTFIEIAECTWERLIKAAENIKKHLESVKGGEKVDYSKVEYADLYFDYHSLKKTAR